MDHTAIEAIQETALAAAVNSGLTEAGLILTPNNYTLKNLEKFKSEPDHFRARFETDLISDFIEYVCAHADEHTSIFINPRKPSAKAIIDMGNPDAPKWGKHSAELNLNKTPAFQALIDKNDKAIPQQTFIDFLNDWGTNIVLLDENSAETPLSTGITQLRSLKINASASNEQKTDNFAASRSALESIEVQAAGQRPPARMVFSTEPHDGFRIIDCICEIRALVSNKDVQLKFRIVGLEQIENAIAHELIESLHTGINSTDASIYIGEMTYQ